MTESGTAVAGTASTPIANVAANDSVNGQQATLGASGNATIATSGTWPAGITLNTGTGAISVAASVPPGTYNVTYQLCDKNTPVNCATMIDTITVKAPVANMSIDTSGMPPTASVGVPYVGTLTCTNTGPDAAAGAICQVPDLPSGFTMTCTPSSPVQSLPAGQSITCTVSGTPTVSGALNLSVYSGAINDPNSTSKLAVVVIQVKAPDVSLRVIKTAVPRDVHIGDIVRYTVSIENVGSSNVTNTTLEDTPPEGFTYVSGSLTVADKDGAGRLVGTKPIRVDQIDIDQGKTATITYLLRVGAGVRAGGIYTNAAVMQYYGAVISNKATVDVRVIADPMTDESLIIGSVFDDRNANGWQDSAKATGLKLQGGFAPSAYMANSTTVDRGNGAKPEPDASSPMLHGLVVGDLEGRSSTTTPLDKHTVVVRQKLATLAFTDDFVVTNEQGYTVRMRADGQTTVEKSGDAAKGRTVVELQVERKVDKLADGYQVDYIIRNVGVNERGIPGVRIASVEGLIVETDQFGRYSLLGINGGRWERGRQFILKVDPASLPPGAKFTTDNPLLRRITPGLPVRFDFGVQLMGVGQ